MRRVINKHGVKAGHHHVQSLGGGSSTSVELRRVINMCRAQGRVIKMGGVKEGHRHGQSEEDHHHVQSSAGGPINLHGL